jgi:hypothetical protein
MAEIQTIIGSLPVLRGAYDGETSYYRDNQVTMFGSTFQSVADDNVGNPPAEERDDGKVYAINTDKWVIVANALGAYNAGSRIDKLAENTEIKNEEGKTIKTPFREIESPEFLHCIVDAEDLFLFGIQLDGSIEWGKGIPAPIRTKLQEIITQCQQDKTDLLGSINTINGILDKTTIKDEAGEIQDTPFRVISNEEFLWAVVDSEDRLIFGIYRESGKPYFPLNEMYHVEQNEEFFAVWLDTNDKVVLGIRRDGQIIGEIHAVNAMKQVISQLQSDLVSLKEKVGTIDTNLRELLDVFSLQENPEYLAVEQDAEGKVLSSTNLDGSHYIRNAKSETIPEEFEHTEDPEGRTEITTDSDSKILGYRDSEGTRHEHKISVNHLELSDEAANEVNDAFKSAGIKMENPSDFSKDSHIELPIPRIAAQVRIYAPKLPTTKQDDIEAEIEYNDKDGNYFRKPIILNAQGASSMNYYVKNMAIDLNDGCEIKFGDFPTQDSFHLKKYYIDAFRGQCIVGYWLMEQVYKSRPIGHQYPYEYSYLNDSVTDGLGDVKKDFFTGAKCHPDGFPIIITWVNTETKEETWMGVYAWNLKKSKEVYNCDKKKAENIILDGDVRPVSLWNGTVDWTAFEIRNPKSLIDIDGNKYDGDSPKELSNTDALSKKVKGYIERFAGAVAEIKANKTKEMFEKYFIPDIMIDFFLFNQITYNIDGIERNTIWVSYTGNILNPTLYDLDSIFGQHASGTFIFSDSANSNILGLYNTLPTFYLHELYLDEIEKRYAELRNTGIFTVENVKALFDKWCTSVGYDNFKKEFETYPETHSYRKSNVVEQWELEGWGYGDKYDPNKTYSKGDICNYMDMTFKAKETVTGITPTKNLYQHSIQQGGFYNSVQRVCNWLAQRIAFLDKTYNYK